MRATSPTPIRSTFIERNDVNYHPSATNLKEKFSAMASVKFKVVGVKGTKKSGQPERRTTRRAKFKRRNRGKSENDQMNCELP